MRRAEDGDTGGRRLMHDRFGARREAVQATVPASKTSESGDAAAVPTLSVVICVFPATPRERVLRSCNQVLAHLASGDELVVVVDYDANVRRALSESLDDTGPVRAAVISNRHYVGLSGVRNTGLTHATKTVVAFVDDDADVDTGWVRRLRDHYADRTVMAVGGVAVPTWEPASEHVMSPADRDHDGDGIRAVDVLYGCNVSFRRAVFDIIEGSFHTAVQNSRSQPLEWAEAELCERLRERVADATFIFDPGLVVFHAPIYTSGATGYLRRRCYGYGPSRWRPTVGEAWRVMVSTVTKGAPDGRHDVVGGLRGLGSALGARLVEGARTVYASRVRPLDLAPEIDLTSSNIRLLPGRRVGRQRRKDSQADR